MTEKMFHIMAKPAGPQCNLDCSYCFYKEKTVLFAERRDLFLDDEKLEIYIRKYIQAACGQRQIFFAWQGGEPMLRGLDFYRRVVDLQKKYAGGRQIINALQTNGTLLTKEWCLFLRQHDFLVGLSLDGPAEIHDAYRIDLGRRPTFSMVFKGLRLLQKYGVEYNVLCTVTKRSAYHARKIYRFFKQAGVEFIQFTPVVERQPDDASSKLGLSLAVPNSNSEAQVTVWSVEREKYGDFLLQVFDIWYRHDKGRIHVVNFEWALAAWLGLPAPICVFGEECGNALIMEHNGDVYSCDHYVYPQYRLGNIIEEEIGDMLDSRQQLDFNSRKRDSLAPYCRQCPYLFACNGDCPKHRFMPSLTGEGQISYLCPSYRKFFSYIDEAMQNLAREVRLARR